MDKAVAPRTVQSSIFTVFTTVAPDVRIHKESRRHQSQVAELRSSERVRPPSSVDVDRLLQNTRQLCSQPLRRALRIKEELQKLNLFNLLELRSQFSPESKLLLVWQCRRAAVGRLSLIEILLYEVRELLKLIQDLSEPLNFGRNMLSMAKQSGSIVRNILGLLQHPLMIVCRQFGQGAQNDPDLSREFFVQLWVADRKMQQSGVKRKPRSHRFLNHGESGSDSQFFSQFTSGRHFSGGSAAEEKSFYESKQNLRQPPPSQSVTGILQPSSPEEAMVAPLLARSNLLITRDIEWANLVLGFEQENRYAIVDVCYPQSPAGYIREKSNVLARQLLRLRRPFVAYITDGLGNELFRVRRPFWWITSSIYAEINGKEIGVVHRRWHLWRRIYDLYLGNEQFAVVENPGFWNWTFTLKDIDGKVLAQIDRDWRGFGFEIFTDAGQYVIQFGRADSSIAPVGGIQELDVVRPLTLTERAVAVALAISLDNDYFSRHGGWGIPFVEVGE